MYKFLKWLATSMVLCILAGCCSRPQRFFRRKLYFAQQAPMGLQHKQRVPTITIWIHGARPFEPNTYNLGLKSPTLFEPTHPIARIANTLIDSDPIKFPLDHFYIYSWSGIMDFAERQHAADLLYTAMNQLIDGYKNLHNITPKIRLIGHSHGGNIALNLAATPNNNLLIDDLILLAIPVQDKNKALVSSPLFKRVFSLYSTIDYAQIIDPQGLYKDSETDSFFSGQRFDPSKNLMQIKTKINGIACKHLQFNDLATLKLLPAIIEELNNWMDETPAELLLSDETRFMLSVYTNGRHAPRAKCYRAGGAHEHIELHNKETALKIT